MANYNSSHTGAEIDSAIGRVKDTAVTAGTISASLGVVVDANKDISGFRNVTLTGQLQAATINLTGDTTIGDGDSDNITINADVNSNIIPNTDNTFDLGSASKQWKDLYVNGIGYIDQLGTDGDPIAIYASSGEIDGTAIGSESASTGAFTTISASGNVDFNADLDVDGVTNLDVVDIDGAVDMASTLTVAGNQNLTGDLTIGAHANGNTTGHAVLNLAADANEGADSYLNFDAGTTTKGHIAYDHHATASSQAMKFVVGDDGTTAMTILGDGKVGIGTTSPSDLLHLSASVPIIRLTDSDTNDYHRIYGSNGSLYFDADKGNSVGSSKIAFGVDDSNVMNITDGKVGIGTTSPGDYSTSGDDLVVKSLAHTGISIVSPTNQSGNLMFADGTSGDAQYKGFIQYDHGNNVTDAMMFGTNGSEKMRIDSSGNVGIGGSPDSLLHVKTTANVSETIRIQNDDSLTTIGVSSDGYSFHTYQHSLYWASWDGSTWSTKARLDNNGNLGIGTTNPFAKLHINETTNGQELIFLNHSVTGANQTYLQFRHDGTLRGNIQVNDSNDQIVYNTTASDKRLKQDFEEWDESILPAFKSLKPQLFNFKNSENKSGKTKGYIAQDNVEEFPEAYTTSKVLDDDDTEYYSFNPSGMVAYLMKAVQELSVQNDALTARIEALEA